MALADDPFYETRLASGKRAYAEKNMHDAATDLRIAAFGFLDRPPLLSETLVWLTLAESAVQRPDMTRWALTRFVDVEMRYHPYKALALDAGLRTAFEKILVATLSRDTVASVPTLAELVAPAAHGTIPPVRESASPGTRPNPSPAQRTPASVPFDPIVPPPAAKTAPAPPAAAVPSPGSPPKAAQSRIPAPPLATVPKESEANRDSGDPLAPVRPVGTSGAEAIAKARELLQQNKNDEALTILRDLVGRAPSRLARILLIHAATRSHDWRLSAAQIPFVQPFNDGEEVTMFYAAVALYRTGKVAEARPLLERALPGINPSTYVESYKQKIIGR
jgi:tetratricopeptide (TPR) repeat protein